MPKSDFDGVGYIGDRPSMQVIVVDANGDTTTYDFRQNEPVWRPELVAAVCERPDFAPVLDLDSKKAND